MLDAYVCAYEKSQDDLLIRLSLDYSVFITQYLKCKGSPQCIHVCSQELKPIIAETDGLGGVGPS